MQKTRDSYLEFKVAGEAPCACRLRVYESPEKPTIVLFTPVRAKRAGMLTAA